VFLWILSVFGLSKRFKALTSGAETVKTTAPAPAAGSEPEKAAG